MNPSGERKRAQNPRERANIFSKLSFWYTGGLFNKGYKQDLKNEDLYEVIGSCRAERCGNKLEKQWNIEQSTNKNPSIYKLLWHRFGKRYLFVGCIDLVYKLTYSISIPYATSNLISYFKPSQTNMTKLDAYMYAFMVMSIFLLSTIYSHNYTLWIQQFAIEIRTAFTSLLYRKALKLTPSAMSTISLGNIVTLITKDVFAFQDSMNAVNDTWNGVAQTFIICYLLHAKIGWVAFIGIGILLGSVPIQMVIGRYMSKLRLATEKKTDERLQITQETLSTIKIIKMYTWERFFGNKISAARRTEMTKMLILFYLRIIIVMVGILFSQAGFFALITCYIHLGYVTDTDFIFYMLTLFTDLKYDLGTLIPYGMGRIAELYSSLVRINKVISAEELTPQPHTNEPSDNPVLVLTNATVFIKDFCVLNDVSLNVQRGLTIVTGTVGSGKSTLLKAFLQDCPFSKGSIVSRGRISYASQDPWLFPSTIRQNILFGEQYNEKRYKEIVRVCALQYDFSLYEEGDQTIVCDRGLNLSRGQQARVNLARAIYKNSDIYLLDDSLTALDPQVQDYIFEECIKKFLKNKLCVLVTQTAHHMLEADVLVVFEEGKIKSCGAPNQDILQKVTAQTGGLDDDLDIELLEKNGGIKTEEYGSEDEPLKGCEGGVEQNVYGETKKQGQVDYETYKKYFMFGGGFLFMILNGFLFALGTGAEGYTDWLLTTWVDEKEIVLSIERNISKYSQERNMSEYYQEKLDEAISNEQFTISLYSVMMFVGIALALLKTYALLNFCRQASVNIHKALLKNIMGAVVAFYDTHFIGNILNRFSQDINNVDEVLPFVFTEFFRVLFTVSGIIFLIVSVKWIFAVYTLIFFLLLYVIRTWYMPTGRSLKRLEASTRSPMIGHLNATLEGVTTIRACKNESILIKEFDRHQDLFTSAYYTSTMTTRAFSFFMDFACTMFINAIVSTCMLFPSRTTVGDIGLAITQAQNLSGEVDWGVKQWADLENLMTSVERIMEYTETKSETEQGVMKENWPSKGEISYENVSLSYNNRETVLKNLNFRIEPGKKLGIVGRTGAGKSSIIATMFRLYDVDGRILIDNVNIKALSLKFLRQKLAIIPQEPVLFSGTIRSNLDPFDEYSDKDLWRALERVNLTGTITSLDSETNSSNSTMSSGQKQLICLARAILRKAKIVILDEATANMDKETDELLNRTIKENFSDCTMFTIAHRLHSILECDVVMVLEKGVIREFDEPKALLGNENGHFYRMVQQAGLLQIVKK